MRIRDASFLLPVVGRECESFAENQQPATENS